MSRQLAAPIVRRHPPQLPTADATRQEATRSVRRAGFVAGIALLLMAGLAAFSDLFVIDGLVTPGAPAQTVSDIAASEGVFRLGVAGLYLVVVLDIVVAWALFRFFAPVSSSLSRLAAWLRLAYSGVYLVAISQLAGVPALLREDTYSAAFDENHLAAQAMLKIESYNDIWMAALLLVGVHLMVLGYLVYRSGYVPWVLGVLLAIAGAGYAFDTFSSVLSATPLVVSTVTFLGEFLLALWLVIRSRRVVLEAGRHEV